jgi:hypothetical protein
VARVDLPATGWSWSGTSYLKRYSFRSPDPHAPVRRVTVQNGVITIRGGAAAFGYSLSAAPQGSVAVRLRLGTGVTWCAEAPAASLADDRVDRFVAKVDSAAPAQCPLVP